LLNKNRRYTILIKGEQNGTQRYIKETFLPFNK
jgi:hypothetical protein